MLALFFPADGFAEEFGGFGEPEFFFDAGAVGVDGLEVDVEFLGDLFGVVALAQQLEHFQLAVAEQRHGRLTGRRHAADEISRRSAR